MKNKIKFVIQISALALFFILSMSYRMNIVVHQFGFGGKPLLTSDICGEFDKESNSGYKIFSVNEDKGTYEVRGISKGEINNPMYLPMWLVEKFYVAKNCDELLNNKK